MVGASTGTRCLTFRAATVRDSSGWGLVQTTKTSIATDATTQKSVARYLKRIASRCFIACVLSVAHAQNHLTPLVSSYGVRLEQGLAVQWNDIAVTRSLLVVSSQYRFEWSFIPVHHTRSIPSFGGSDGEGGKRVAFIPVSLPRALKNTIPIGEYSKIQIDNRTTTARTSVDRHFFVERPAKGCCNVAFDLTSLSSQRKPANRDAVRSATTVGAGYALAIVVTLGQCDRNSARSVPTIEDRSAHSRTPWYRQEHRWQPARRLA